MKTNKQPYKTMGIYIFLMALMLNLSLLSTAQEDPLFMNLDMTEISSGVFLPKAKPCLKPDGSEYEYLSRNQVKQIIYALEEAQVNSTDFIPEISQFREGLKSLNASTEYIPITIVESSFHSIKSDALENGLLELNGESLEDISGPLDTPYEEGELIAFFVDHEYYHRQNHTFILDEECYINNLTSTPTSIEIDFDDGLGFRNVEIGNPIEVTYNDASDRNLRMKLTRNGITKKAGNFLKSGGGNSGLIPDPDAVPWPNLIDDEGHPYQFGSNIITGTWAMADAYTLTSADGIFDKPFIFVEGIDFGSFHSSLENGTFGWDDFASGESIEYPMMHDMPFFIDELRQKDYDIVFLDFDDGATYIQDNASTLVELINRCNDYKVGNEPLIVAGASMGGQVSRYALRWMELNEMDHCTQMYISLDSPHTGANIPLGMQFLLKGLTYSSTTAVDRINESLFKPAARQLLKYQLPEEMGLGEYGTWRLGLPTYSIVYDEETFNPGSLFDEYYSEINQMGFPQKTINVGLSNGNNTGDYLDLNLQLIDFNCETEALVNPLIDIEFVVTRNDIDNAQLARIKLKQVGFNEEENWWDYWQALLWPQAYFFDSEYEYYAPYTTSSSLPMDLAPGGTRSTMNEVVESINESLESGAILEDDFVTLSCHIEEDDFEEFHSFIPTVSALGIDLEHLMTDLSTHPEIVSPFDYTYSPSSGNEAHSEVNPENISYMLNLIFSHHLPLPDELTSESDNNGVFNITGGNNANIKDVTIYDGGELYINANIPSNFDWEFDEIPEPGNHIDVSPLTCSSYLTVGDNGLLHVGEGEVDGLDNTVNLYITDGFLLTVEPGGKLVIDNNSTLIVRSGGEVYIKDETSLGEHGKIIVEPGGKLTIDGATVTSISDSVWEGIEVQGDKELNQLPKSNQGHLVLKNGALIENAECAVRLVKNTVTSGWIVDWNTTGGIVEATQTTFRNNQKDVEFLFYENHNSLGNSIPNISVFRLCTFEVDDNVLFQDLSANVTSYKCYGMNFQGCTFIDERSNVERHQKRTGIGASHSSFGVNEYCGVNNPLSNGTCEGIRSQFVNMGYGIQSWNQNNPWFTTKVKNSDFDDCWKGIHFTGVTQSDIMLNDFYITGTENLKYDYDGPVGLYLDNQCRGYTVTENYFHGPDATDGISVGVVVANGHSETTEIYGNSFNSLYMAAEALGQNRAESDADYFGLVIQCNEFSNNVLDINVDDYYSESSVVGVNPHQGEASTLASEFANNSFFNAPYMEWNFRNVGEHIFYVRNSIEPSHELTEYLSSSITQFSLPGVGEACPSKLTPKTLTEKSLQLAESIDGILETNAEKSSLVDGGDSFSLELDVVMTNDADAWANYLELMNNAGYLSEEVLKEVSQKEDGFSNAMIRNILVANAHAAKSKKVNEKLDERISPLPAYMLEQIKMGLTQISSKEYLQLQLAGHKIDFDQAIEDALKIISDDESIADKTSAFVEWMSGTNDINWDYQLLALYDASNMENEANLLLSEMESNYSFSDSEAAELERLIEYRSMINSWQSAGIDMSALENSNITFLENFSEGHDRAAVRARTLLYLNESLEYIPPVILPNDNETRSLESQENPDKGFDNGVLEVSPNPTVDFFNFHYRINEEFVDAKAVLMDNKGVFVKTISIENPEDELLVPTQSIASGSYQLLVIVDGKIVLKESVTLL